MTETAPIETRVPHWQVLSESERGAIRSVEQTLGTTGTWYRGRMTLDAAARSHRTTQYLIVIDLPGHGANFADIISVLLVTDGFTSHIEQIQEYVLDQWCPGVKFTMLHIALEVDE